MSEERIIYGICQANCREPVYSREETLSILQQAVEAGSLQGIDIAKLPIVKQIRETRADGNISFWIGTEAQFNTEISKTVNAAIAIARIDLNGKVYFCTDDTTFSDWQAATLELLEEQQTEAINAFESNVNDAVANKTDKVSGATAGNFAGLTAEGLLQDSGKKAADFQEKHKTATVSLTTTGWSSSAKTVSVTGVTASNTVIVAPAPASADVYNAAGIKCTSQAAGKLTFTYKKAPTETMTVNILILGV